MSTSSSQQRHQNSSTTTEPNITKTRSIAENGPRLWTVKEAASFLHISEGTLFHWTSQRKVPCVRFSLRCLRFDPEEIMRWAAEHSHEERDRFKQKI